MEMTLPGRHETIEKQDPVHQWRVGAARRGSRCASSADTRRLR